MIDAIERYPDVSVLENHAYHLKTVDVLQIIPNDFCGDLLAGETNNKVSGGPLMVNVPRNSGRKEILFVIPNNTDLQPG